MPRLREVPRAEAEEKTVLALYAMLFGDRDPVAEPGTATGTPGDWWTVFANSPATLKHAAQGFAYYRSPERKLDPVLRELGQTWAGWATGSQFVFSQHCKSLRGLAVPEEKIESIPTWQTSDAFSARERLVLAYSDRLVTHAGRVPDALFAQVKAEFSDEEILELTYITCLYQMHAVMSRALRTEFDDRDDPITEVPAPEGFDAMDFLGGERRGR
ncbi:Alkylhydroperoxidase family enzyme, contains CxxC motif [Erythrobacter litoralis]|jgi:alkylhydroperoxidase family enzyme|uniref:Carboxymuconolactone decarboxylase n=1 Tax=Erythrobacter litoralis TaxID=39960 RepID=A0A074MUR2_9SPHN|nr:carboxymuconolactone decarboxylase family protein [Erythrobacter litoralis]AOL24610.1 Alkylhydroperoxidase family enzyme, contains CxxC motif [Erythrobacter litoralis]KEO89357.1 carboxymuconolactone decarboxylase [Erythrobacter litoralis]MEE4337672.1 carboxymuconolactone decarboxylase family protein [Erythrobacter sp.]